MNRKEAKAAGALRYVGRPCKHGHLAARYVSNGLCTVCAVIVNKKSRHKAWAARPDEMRAKQNKRVRRWRKKNPKRTRELSRAAQQKYRAADPLRYKAYKWRRAGVGMPTRPAPPACECCGKPGKRLCLDHDHVTLKFRGWLCDACNMGIGRLGDSRDSVLAALRYFDRAEQ
jgi:Recombination endonuclease VII